MDDLIDVSSDSATLKPTGSDVARQTNPDGHSRIIIGTDEDETYLSSW